jgi:hypothetical protein
VRHLGICANARMRETLLLGLRSCQYGELTQLQLLDRHRIACFEAFDSTIIFVTRGERGVIAPNAFCAIYCCKLVPSNQKDLKFLVKSSQGIELRRAPVAAKRFRLCRPVRSCCPALRAKHQARDAGSSLLLRRDQGET